MAYLYLCRAKRRGDGLERRFLVWCSRSSFAKNVQQFQVSGSQHELWGCAREPVGESAQTVNDI